MKAKDCGAADYPLTSAIARLIGDVVGSQDLGTRIFSSVVSPDETASDDNIQARLREAISLGSLRVKGLGPQKLQRLKSALALGKALYVNPPEIGQLIEEPAVAAQAFHEIAWEPVEKFAVLALDVKHRVLSVKVVSTGTATETCAHPRDIFGWLLKVGATRCIVAHNHPSGSVNPSAEDCALTQKLLAAAKVMAIPVLDHLIVHGTGFASIRQTTCLWDEAK